jgi:cytochrome c oxidase subunit 1
MPDASI